MLPSAYMRGVDPDYAAGLFATWRRDPAFVLSRPGWQHAAILVSGSNFGCGSTREHATWALDAFGIRVLVAGSFGEVFRDNCIKNGILPIAAAAEALDGLRGMLRAVPGPVRLQVDLVGADRDRSGAYAWRSTSRRRTRRPCWTAWTRSA